MKVAYLSMSPNFRTDIGQGVQKYIYELYSHIKKMSDDVEKVALGNGKISFTFLQLIYPFYKFNLIHMPAPIAFNPPLRRCPTLTTLHELVVHDNSNEYLKIETDSKSFNYDLISRMIRNQILNSDYLMPNSTQTYEEALSQGYPKERLFLVNHGIDDVFLSKIPKKMHSKVFKVGYIGAHNKRKNVVFAFEAMSKINEKDIVLEVYGLEGYYSKNVKLMGKLKEADKLKAYDSFDAFVFPSFYEGFGLPILEAQARGLPVIIYKYGKIPKEVRKYCFEAEDPEHMAQIIMQLKENGYNEKLQKKATEYARSFTWEKTARKTLEVYKKIVEE
jgi:glycosyltransferase involved in cell wall biosynthesis